MEISECEGSYCVCLNVDLIERQAAEIESLKRDCEEKDDLSDQLLATSVRLRAWLERIATPNMILTVYEYRTMAQQALAGAAAKKEPQS